jgi:hypothetical protein
MFPTAKQLKHPPHLVVGFNGQSGAGKTTVARMVKERLHFLAPTLHCVIHSFAEPLKRMLEVVGVDRDHPLYADATQQIGTDVFRALDEDFWVSQFLDRLHGMDKPAVVLVDDVRFENEAVVCDYVVRLLPGTRDIQGRMKEVRHMLHGSEMCLDFPVSEHFPAAVMEDAEDMAVVLSRCILENYANTQAPQPQKEGGKPHQADDGRTGGCGLHAVGG